MKVESGSSLQIRFARWNLKMASYGSYKLWTLDPTTVQLNAIYFGTVEYLQMVTTFRQTQRKLLKVCSAVFNSIPLSLRGINHRTMPLDLIIF